MLLRAAGTLAALAVVLTALAACVPEIREPDVRLTGVRLAGLGLQGGVVYVEIGVSNPNRFAIEADGLTYDLDLRAPADDDGADEGSWLDLAEGTFEEDFGVEGRDSATVEIPVEFRYAAVGDVLRSVLSRGTVGYRLEGRVVLEEPLRTDLPFRRRGTVTILSR